MSETTPSIREEIKETDSKIEENELPKKGKTKKKKRRLTASEMKKETNQSGKKPTQKANKNKPKNAKKTFKRLFGYMMKSKKLLILVAFLVIFSAVIMVASTAINEPIINLCTKVLNPANRMPRNEFISQLALWLGLMVGLSVIASLSNYAYARIMLHISQKTMLVIRKDLFDHIQKLPVKYFDTNKRGDIMSRFTSDVSTINNIINDGMTTLISSGITLVGTVGMMLYYSPKITITLFFCIIVMVVFIILIGALSSKQFKKYQKAMGECNGFIEEYIRGQRIVKIFGQEENNKKKFHTLANNLRKVGIGANTISGLLSPIMSFISKISYSIGALMGGMMIIRGRGNMNVGRLVAYLSYAKGLTSPITSLASQFTSLMSALAGAERIFEIMDMPEELDEGTVKMVKAVLGEDGEYTECDDYGWVYVWKIPLSESEYIYTPVAGRVKFDHVSFGYNEDKTVLKNISLEAKPNEKIAFVGSTGAGKTTITNLVNRFYDINEGEITVDGINIQSICKDDLRHSLSMVLQDTHLFSGTVADNIRYGRLDATDEEVIEAAKIANAHSFITRLPDGYNTEIKGDGKNLSQGQRQLLSIARAAVADPQILILDEATSSIDTRTEKLIEQGMDQLMENRTVFVIAHRLSTVRNSDTIMVLENGEIIESGNHDELIEKEGKYYQLYNGLYELD